MIKRISALIIAALWLVSLVQPVQAGLGIMPKQLSDEPTRSWFIYTMNPGESRSDTVMINNNTNDSITVVVEGLDGITTTDGSYSLAESIDDNRDIGRWITPEASEVSLEPNSSVEVGFTVTVPEDASVGEHNGGIVAYIKPRDSSSDGINLRVRTAARIYITIPGVVERQITFSDVSYEIKDGKLLFDIKARNDSNIRIEPALNITLSGWSGRHRQEILNNGVYLADSDIELTKTWDRPAPKFGYYTVELVFHTWTVNQILADGTESELPDAMFSHSFSFWVGTGYIGWWIGGLILFWIIYRLSIYWLDRRRYLARVEIYTVKKGETIMHVAEQTGVMAQVITKFNRLPWPRTVNPKDQLLIPRSKLHTGDPKLVRPTKQLPSVFVYLLSARSSLYHPTVDDFTKVK